jgi:hypothetical protein
LYRMRLVCGPEAAGPLLKIPISELSGQWPEVEERDK